MFPTDLQLDVIECHPIYDANGARKQTLIRGALVGPMGEFYGHFHGMDERLAEELVRRYNAQDNKQ